ncbi:hypothetical protein V4U94_005843 [Candida albicans]
MYTTIEHQQQQQQYEPMPESQHSSYFKTAFNTTRPLDDYEDQNTTNNNKLTNSIQKLSINTNTGHPHPPPPPPPPDSKKFNFVCVFFNRILNLKDPTIILEKNKDIGKFNEVVKIDRQQSKQQPIEIMKNLVFPADIWIRDEIKVKDAKIKTTMLNEVNELIETELKDVNDQTTFEEITLNYYAKLLVAYKVYDIPTRTIYNSYPNYIQNSILLSLEEEEEQQQQQNQNQNHNEDNNKNSEFDFGFLEKPVYRTSSNQSNSSQKSKDKRSSNGSTLSRKRFSSFLGSNGHGHGHGNSSSKDSSPDHNHTQPHSQQYHHSQMASPTTPTSQINLPPPNSHSHSHSHSHSLQQSQHHQHSSLSSSPTFQQEGTFNNLLTKTKLYGRIKKHRESQASINSTGSQHSINSNRNSVSTNATATSSGSRRRSNYTINSFGGGNSAAPNTPTLSLLSSSISTIQDEHFHQENHTSYSIQELKLENSKEKYEYYIQILRLFKNSEKILKTLINSHNINNKLLKFIEFIKKKLLKFIMIDIMSMILTYCDLQCINFYNIK